MREEIVGGGVHGCFLCRRDPASRNGERTRDGGDFRGGLWLRLLKAQAAGGAGGTRVSIKAGSTECDKMERAGRARRGAEPERTDSQRKDAKVPRRREDGRTITKSRRYENTKQADFHHKAQWHREDRGAGSGGRLGTLIGTNRTLIGWDEDGQIAARTRKGRQFCWVGFAEMGETDGDGLTTDELR